MMNDWNAPIYAFFVPVPDIEYVFCEVIRGAGNLGHPFGPLQRFF